MFKSVVLSLCLVALLSGCSSVSVSRDYDTSVDFSAFKTFAWLHEKQPQVGNPRVDNDLTDARVRAAVNADLSAKGITLSSKETADFLVAYYVDFDKKLNSSSVSFGIGRSSAGRYGGVGYDTGINETEYGILTIDILRPSTKEMIWRSVGKRAVYEGSNPEKSAAIITASVQKILAKFPPKKKLMVDH